MLINKLGKIKDSNNYHVISDTHFFDRNIITKGDRRVLFSDIYEMNEYLIDRWNSVVKPDEVVIHLGDVYNNDDLEFDDLKSVLDRLNGVIYAAVGNNDNVEFLYRSKRFESFHLWLRDYDKGLILSHAPLADISYKCYGDEYLNVHGHIHTMTPPVGDYINVSADVIDLTPIRINSLLNL